MAGCLLQFVSQLCALPDLMGFGNDQSAKVLRPGERPRTFCDRLIGRAQPSTNTSKEPSQPLEFPFDSLPLSKCQSGQVQFAFFRNHFRHDQLHPATVKVVLER